MSYDEKCWYLAEDFLPDNASKEIKDQLAQAIQTAIEDELASIGECERCGSVPANTFSVAESTPTDRGDEIRHVDVKLCAACAPKGHS